MLTSAYTIRREAAPLISDGAMVAAVNRSLAGPTIESDDVFMSAIGTKQT